MLEFSVFLYGLLSGFVLISAEQNRRLDRPNPAMVNAVGWGLFAMSATLALLCLAVALAAALGAPLPAQLNALAAG